MRLNYFIKFVLVFQVLFGFNALAATCVSGIEGESIKIAGTDKAHLNEIFALEIVWADPIDVEFWVEQCISNNDIKYSLITTVTPTVLGKSKGAIHYDIAIIQDNKQFDGTVNYSDNLYVPGDFISYPDYFSSNVGLELSRPFTLIFSCSEKISYSVFNACSTVNPDIYFDLNPQSNSNNLKISSVNGAWYDPVYNGSGFNVVQTPVGLLIFYYGYKENADGEALWLISSIGPKVINKGETFTLDLKSGFLGNGGSLVNKPNTANSGTHKWGTAEVIFNTCNSGIVKLTNNNGVIVTHNVELLAGVDKLDCRDDL